MTVEEQARQYAEGKALNVITSAIEQAYHSGYVAGYNESIRNRRMEQIDEECDEAIMVDLGLPSGTLWSSTQLLDEKRENPKIFLYDEAVQLQIPSWDQFYELKRLCMGEKLYKGVKEVGIRFTGRNGKHIEIYYNKRKNREETSNSIATFWLKDEINERNYVKCPVIGNLSVSSRMTFIGEKLPVMLVI